MSDCSWPRARIPLQLGCSQNHGPLFVMDYIAAPFCLGEPKWDLTVGNYPLGKGLCFTVFIPNPCKAAYTSPQPQQGANEGK